MGRRLVQSPDYYQHTPLVNPTGPPTDAYSPATSC